MKRFTTLFEQTKAIAPALNNYIDAATLQKYLDIVKIFISDNSKTVIQYLIEHNNDYMQSLGGGDTESNVLDKFLRGKEPINKEKNALWNTLKAIEKDNRLKEIPLYQTTEEFDQIMTKKIAPDRVFLDFDSEEGKNEIVRRYDNLVHKLALQYANKSNASNKDLVSAAYLGLTYAINQYGKRNRSEVDDEVLNSKTFGQFATYQIRVQILEEIKHRSQTVRIPLSAQQAERNERGSNTKSYTVSGEKTIGNDENSKTLFDIIGGSMTADRETDENEIERLWKEVYAELEKEFDANTIELFYHKFGLNGRKEMKVQEISNKFGIVPSNVTYYTSKINRYIQKNTKLMAKLEELYELMKECRLEWDHDDDIIEEGVQTKLLKADEE